MSLVTIAIDAMGGDHGPKVTVPGALRALAKHKDLHLILVGDQTVLMQQLAHAHFDAERLDIQHASEQVLMDESPAQALRSKKDSSMRVAINLVKQGIAQACISAGNTGALMATASFVLKTIPGIDRPAVIARLPTLQPNHWVHILDLGANVQVQAQQLLQFAIMGSVAAQALGNPAPRVALLNIGVEEIKGNALVKEAAVLLAAQPELNYVGYIEGHDIFKGYADVVVCDGFVGNILLKTVEGVTQMIQGYARAAFMRNWFNRLIGLLAIPSLRYLKQQLDPNNYNGASLLGLQACVIKSHGSADVAAFAQAISNALQEVHYEIPQHIHQQVSRLLQVNPANNEPE